ncbi:MAG TPA: hypothetical protein VFQ38_11530 [Longimicrobiales bacterium]|nr:hypothetical protein [Longimicrobiales bacterium]
MIHNVRWLLAGAVALGAAGCSDRLTDAGPGGARFADLSAAFVSVPLGYDVVLSSYGGGPDAGLAPWTPVRGEASLDRGSMMGGGLGSLFLGGTFVGGFGRGPFHHGFGFDGFGLGHWPFGDGAVDSSCTFDAGSGRLVCPAVTRNGVTIERSVAFLDAAGKPQQAYDTVTTNTIDTRLTVSGTLIRSRRPHRDHDGDGAVAGNDTVRTTVQDASDRTVSGLAKGSAQRTVNGTSAGKETTTGSDTTGTFTVVRVVGDTVKNVVVPVASDSIRYPVSGSVTRSMQVTLTRAGQAPTASTRREVVTYNGTNTATVVITVNGTTKTCTLPLPRGRLNCPSP